MTNENIFRSIPQVEKIISDPRFALYIGRLGKPAVTNIVREEIESFRLMIRENKTPTIDELFERIVFALKKKLLSRLQRIINGTGVILHTNFGRSPLPKKELNTLAEELSCYCNLEFSILEKRRGKRGMFAEELLASLTGSEDALVVNNNAAAVFLILSEFAKNRSVIISRSELVQIGGGFRIPDILRQSGARLKEIGTTNITTLDDYRAALDDETAMILSVHKSNFTIKGFTESPSLAELASLKSDKIIFVRDLGSGNLVKSHHVQIPLEPNISYELSQGCDLISFSGDKLLNASQCGIIVGRAELIARLRKNPLMRVIRVDKFTYYLLQQVLLYYANNDWQNLPIWKMIMDSTATIKRRILRFMRNLSPELKKLIKIVPLKSTIGGGAMPSAELDSMGISIEAEHFTPDEIYDHFIRWHVPIAGMIVENRYVLDFRTIFDDDIKEIASAFTAFFAPRGNRCT
ncbi:MAG: L-seryl-tRNA(Sec) selenium transferase [Spirochaetes bacterium]|nr:L-seryl-tRNA(Sec) selenium transferase [Spirochaetota bacterium]